MKYTMLQYRELGKEFKQLNDRLVRIAVAIGSPKRTRYFDRLHRCNRHLNSVRSDLEEEMFRDYPLEASTDIFYGVGDREKLGLLFSCETKTEEAKP